jgi:uncharacterized protein
MPVRLLPWQPEYGTAMQFDADADAPDEGADGVDLAVERETWAPVTPSAGVDRVYLVDGVRRAEAHALDDDGGASPVFGLFGSFAIGAVALEGGSARLMQDRIRVERRYLHTGTAEVPDRVLRTPNTSLAFASRPVPAASRTNDLVAALNRAMLDEEARLAATLSEDESALTLVDGPLRSLRAPGRRVVGYIKRLQQWYVPRAELELLGTLLPGERSPLFTIPPSGGDGPEHGDGRYSWFVRLPAPGAHVHYLGGVMRLECSAAISLERAALLADQATTLLPRLASSPVRDPRAPQNLTPVGALESHLTHLLGDRRLIHRLLAASVAAEADGGEAA